MKELTQEIFKDKSADIEVACVDYNGMLHFDKNVRNLRYTWASEQWRGFDKVESIENTDYKPLTKILRENK